MDKDKNIISQFQINSNNSLKENAIRVNPDLIEDAINGDYTRELAFFYLLKFTYRNSCIYDVRQPKQRIAALAGVSFTTASRWMTTLILRGLIIPRKGYWELEATPRTSIRHRIYVNEKPTVKEIRAALLFIPIKAIGRKQALKDNLTQFLSDSTEGLKDYGKYLRKETFAPWLSVRFIAKVLKMSECTACYLIKEWNRQGIIKTTKSEHMFMFPITDCDLSLLEGFPGHKYIKEGGLYKVDASRHEFLQDNLGVKPITLERYRKMSKNFRLRALIDEINQSIRNEQVI